MKERPAAPDHAPLFRQEALDARRAPLYGGIVLLPGASSRVVALVSLTVVVALALLIVLGSYTRRSTVGGQLMPSEGLIRVTAGQPGIVVERNAADGQLVKRGDLLFVVSGDRIGPGAIDYQQGIARQIESRRLSLESDLRRIGLAESQEAELLRRRIDSLRGERDQVARQGALQAARVKGAEDALARYQGLFRQGFVSRDELLARETEVTEVRGRVEAQRRDELALERELGTTRREIDALRSRYANQRAELERAILLTRQEYTEVEARRRVAVTAPADGKLTLVQAEIGQTVDPTRALAHLVPASAELVARLVVPSRAAGFVQPGATVLLRYDPFPYQKFGQHRGTVLAVSAAAVASAELQGLVARPEFVGETMFAITVGLPDQALQGDGRMLPLQAGMRVEADLLHETRRLYEWILEPLYAARARVDTH